PAVSVCARSGALSVPQPFRRSPMSLLQKVFQAFRKSSVVRSPVCPAPRARRPSLEALEDRIAPATYTWIGAAGANWNVAANWAGGVAGQFPSSDGDIAVFDGGRNDASVKLPVAVTIGAIQAKTGYDQEIQLSDTLTIKKTGLGQGISTFDSAVKI